MDPLDGTPGPAQLGRDHLQVVLRNETTTTHDGAEVVPQSPAIEQV